MPLRFVNPNYHVILVHYPLGVFVLGVFLELFSLLWRKGSIRVAGVWMILIGAILSLPAAASGIYALWDVASSQGGPGGLISQPERYRLLKLHVIFQSCASLLAVICAIVGLGASDAWRAKLRLPLLLGVSAACGMMVFGSWNGGETVYQQGTAVQIVNQNGELQKPEKPVYKTKYSEIVKYYIGGEKQVHIITAGFALSAAMAALGTLNSTPHHASRRIGPARGRSPRGRKIQWRRAAPRHRRPLHDAIDQSRRRDRSGFCPRSGGPMVDCLRFRLTGHGGAWVTGS